jgi:hypothetical protein
MRIRWGSVPNQFSQNSAFNGTTEFMNNTLKTNLGFAELLGANISFHEINKRDQIISFFDSKIKSIEDPD